MFSFFSGKNRCLGVDIGTTGIKMAELKKENNRPVLVNYAFSYDSGSLLQSSDLEILDGQISDMLRGLIKKGEFGTKRCVIGIPSFLALISFLELPEMPREEVEKAVKFEAGKYIPTPIEDVSLGWEIIGTFAEKSLEGGKAERHSQKTQIMVVTVPKAAVEKLSLIAKKTKLNVSAMEVENFATARCLVGNDRGNFMIANIGAKATDFTIVSNSIIRMTRSIDVGGAEISRAIANGLGVDLQRADKIKRSNRINLMNSKEQLSGLVNPLVGMIIEEIKRLIELYHRKNPLNKIEKIIFTGGTSKLSSLIGYISSQVSVDCQPGNSLARIGVEKKYTEVVQRVASELTVAIGLALRGLDEIK